VLLGPASGIATSVSRLARIAGTLTVDLRITHEAGVGTARDTLPSIEDAPGLSGGVPDLAEDAGSKHVAALTSMEMFEMLFPSGITMTADLFDDFENWKRLTEKFTALAG
jgi:hypothetical protein